MNPSRLPPALPDPHHNTQDTWRSTKQHNEDACDTDSWFKSFLVRSKRARRLLLSKLPGLQEHKVNHACQVTASLGFPISFYELSLASQSKVFSISFGYLPQGFLSALDLL